MDIFSSIKSKSFASLAQHKLKGSVSMTQIHFKRPRIPTSALFKQKNQQLELKIPEEMSLKCTEPDLGNSLETPL